MNRLIINLLNFNSDKLAGAGYFFKRIVSDIDFNDTNWINFDEIIFLSNNKVNCIELFNIRNSSKVKVIKVPLVHNFILRIIFEQFLLPFYLIKGVNTLYSPTPSIPLFSKFLNKKNILIPTIHDMIPFKIDNKYSFFRSIYVKIISIKSAQICNKVITVSEFSKKDISAIAKIELSKINVVYNFIPELDLTLDNFSEPYFVTICTIEPGKNLENMITGFYKFLKNNDNFSHYKYIIVGQLGWNYKSILTLIYELNLQDKVILTGYLDNAQKNSILKNSTGMMYLSKYEGFGIPPLEAMYYGKISIVSNTSSLPEVVGEAGIIQDPDNVDLLAENLVRLVVNVDCFKLNIPTQIEKFIPKIQIQIFTELLTSTSVNP